MAIFGIDDAEFDALPDSLKASLKKADEENTANKNNTAALEQRLAKLEEGKQEPTKNEPAPATNKWGVDAITEMNYNNRRDVILMGLKQDKSPQIATCVRMFEDEIIKNLDASHPQLRADKSYILNIVNMVTGQHLAEITQDIRSNGGRFNSLFTEVGTTGGNPNPPAKTAAEQLTAEEKALAEKIGVSYEIFLEQKKEVNQ